jgi:hypothetical protein
MNFDHIAIITSALHPSIGIFNLEERFNQTLNSIKTVRDKIPNCFVVVSDISVFEADQEKKQVSSFVDLFLDFSKDNLILEVSKLGLKSHGEALLFANTLNYLKNNIDLTNIKRIFKLSGRHNITEEFNISDYDNTRDKYVFKKSVQSWINPDWRLYETRFWSMDKSNIDDYLDNFINFYNSLDGTFDIEHAYYRFINKEKVVELDNIWVEGRIAPNGKYQKD